MTCAECEAAAEKRLHGVYRMDCVDCCARLVLSARPSRPHAGAMLAAIERWLLAQSPPPFAISDVTARARAMLPEVEAKEAAYKARSMQVATQTLTDLRSSLLARSGAK